MPSMPSKLIESPEAHLIQQGEGHDNLRAESMVVMYCTRCENHIRDGAASRAGSPYNAVITLFNL